MPSLPGATRSALTRSFRYWEEHLMPDARHGDDPERTRPLHIVNSSYWTPAQEAIGAAEDGGSVPLSQRSMPVDWASRTRATPYVCPECGWRSDEADAP